MDIFKLYDTLFEYNIELKLVGEITLDDESIRWTFDGLCNVSQDMDVYLQENFDADKETIEDFLLEIDNIDRFYFDQPEISESIISAHIYEE